LAGLLLGPVVEVVAIALHDQFLDDAPSCVLVPRDTWGVLDLVDDPGGADTVRQRNALVMKGSPVRNPGVGLRREVLPVRWIHDSPESPEVAIGVCSRVPRVCSGPF